MDLLVTKRMLADVASRSVILLHHPISKERRLAMVSSVGSKYVKILIFDQSICGMELILEFDKYKSFEVLVVENHEDWITNVPYNRIANDLPIPKPKIIN